VLTKTEKFVMILYIRLPLCFGGQAAALAETKYHWQYIAWRKRLKK